MMKEIIYLITVMVITFGMAGFAAAQDAKLQSVNVQTLKSWMDKSEKISLVAAGSILACMDAKIPGAACLTCDSEKDQSFFSTLSKETKIIFYADYQPLEHECALIRRALSAGFKNIYFLEGGLAAWRKAGNPVFSEKRIPRVPLLSVNPTNLSDWQKKAKNPLVIDIRSPRAYDASHLDGAMNIPLSRLHLDYADIPLDRTLLIVDDDGSASFLAASYLANKGFSNAQRLRGGMATYRRGTR